MSKYRSYSPIETSSVAVVPSPSSLSPPAPYPISVYGDIEGSPPAKRVHLQQTVASSTPAAYDFAAAAAAASFQDALISFSPSSFPVSCSESPAAALDELFCKDTKFGLPGCLGNLQQGDMQQQQQPVPSTASLTCPPPPASVPSGKSLYQSSKGAYSLTIHHEPELVCSKCSSQLAS